MINKEASIRAHLKTEAARRGISFQYATLLYMHEGLLRRLAASPYADRFVLKGGLLLQCLSAYFARTTKDIDLLGMGIPNDSDRLEAAFRTICQSNQYDALYFDSESLGIEEINEAGNYHGARVRVACNLGNIHNVVQVDIAFDDAVEAPLNEIEYPTLLNSLHFNLLTYPLASVIAEKFETMIALGDINSRMKDFWDVAYLLGNYNFTDEELLVALKATFQRRNTPMPEDPSVFASDFENSKVLVNRWQAFLRRTLVPHQDWNEVLAVIRTRLSPLYEEIRSTRTREIRE